MVSASLETDQLCVQPINYIYKVQPHDKKNKTKQNKTKKTLRPSEQHFTCSVPWRQGVHPDSMRAHSVLPL